MDYSTLLTTNGIAERIMLYHYATTTPNTPLTVMSVCQYVG